MTTKIASGHDNTAGLTALDPQPAVRRIKAGRIRYAGGRSYEDGYRSTELVYTTLSADQYDALMTAINFAADANSKLITIRLPANEDRAYDADYNATIHKDASGKYRLGMWTDVVFPVTLTEEL